MTGKETIVIKYGSDSVTNGRGMDEDRVAGYVDQLAELHHKYKLVVVSSGAVAVGKAMASAVDQKSPPSQQSFAMSGSAAAFTSWQTNLRRHRIGSGQLLVTHHEIDDKQERKTLLKALQNFLEVGWIPVANENDALSDEELKKLVYGGDNDGLAKHIAVATKASRLVLLTNESGLIDENDRLVTAVATPADYEAAQAMVWETDSEGNGTGWMRSKLQAGWDAAGEGIDAYIAKSGLTFEDVFSGQSTYFPARRQA